MRKILAFGSAGVLALAMLLPRVVRAECNGRSWAPDSRYDISGDGSEVYDRDTKLTWKRCSEGMKWDGVTCTGKRLYVDWFKMKETWPATGEGWRVPNIDELTSLRSGTAVASTLLNEAKETGCWDPAINQSVFPDDPDAKYWASSTPTSNSSWPNVGPNDEMLHALSVYFKYGTTGALWVKGSMESVRLVRGNPWFGRLTDIGVAAKPYEFKPGSAYREMFEYCDKMRSESCFKRFIQEYSGKDPEKLIPQARKKITEIVITDERRKFQEAQSSAKLQEFINDWGKRGDPAKLIPQARQKLVALQRQEREVQSSSTSRAQESARRRGDFDLDVGTPKRGSNYTTWQAICREGGGAFVQVYDSYPSVFNWNSQGFSGSTSGSDMGIGVSEALRKACRGL